MLSRVVTDDTRELERLRRELAEAKAQQRILLVDNARLRGEFVRRVVGEETSSTFRALHDAALATAEPVPLRRRALARFLANIVQRAVDTLGALDGSLVLAPDPAWDDLLGPTSRASAEGNPAESSESDRPKSPSTAGNTIWLDPRGRLSSRVLRPGGATAHVLSTGEAVLVSDTRVASTFGAYESLASRGVLSFALVPLRRSGETLGAVSVNFASPSALQEEERELLELFGAHASAALDRVRLAYTERRLAVQEEELAQRDDEATALRELDRLKTELLTTISHELRTPLTVIHAYAQRLATPGRAFPPERVQVTAERILSASTQLGRLVSDLVDFARIERGEVAVQLQDVDLVPLLRDLVVGFRRQVGRERVRSELPDSLRAHADPARVTQVTSNLIENALKYAPEGPVILRACSLSLDAEHSDAVRIEVVDQGPGIAYMEQERIWDKFFRGSGVAGLNVARGMGIGLAVVRALVEAQGGSVGLESDPGHGSCFWFELPATRSA